jgi:hypothetical protein
MQNVLSGRQGRLLFVQQQALGFDVAPQNKKER